MSKKVSLKFTAVVAVLAVGAMGTASAVSAASKKSHKVKLTMLVIGATGEGASGKVSGTLGKGTIDKSKSSVQPPNVTLLVKYKGGTVTFYSKDAGIGTSANIVGTIKKFKGTGKFKGIKGSLKYTAPLAKESDGSRKFTYTGKLKY